jgi:hypothetical protein
LSTEAIGYAGALLSREGLSREGLSREGLSREGLSEEGLSEEGEDSGFCTAETILA